MSNPSIECEMAILEETAYYKLKEWLFREPTEDEMAEEMEYLMEKYSNHG
jgi:hypothetical protein